MTLLALESAHVRYGGLAALRGVDLELQAGRITGLVGPNGSGKTTLFNVLSGLVRPDRGRLSFDGQDITTLSPHTRARLGIARTFQRLEIFGTLTVHENVLAAVEHHKGHDSPRTTDTAAHHALELVGLTALADEPANRLPIGSARLLELARALVTDPRLLLLDEPSSGLDETETRALGHLLQQLAADGLAVLLAEHDMTLVLGVSEVVHVLDRGLAIAVAPPEDIRRDPAVRAAYLGAPALTARPRTPTAAQPPGRPALELRNIAASYGTITALRGVDLSVPSGRILALLGPNGAGKSTTLKVAAGQLAPTRGTVRVLGHETTGAAPDALARAGICYVPDSNAIFPSLTVDENLLMATYRPRPLKDIHTRAFDLFPRLAERRRQPAGTLSGGEQRMLAVARTLTPHTAVLLLDELSAGLSPHLLADLYAAVRLLADQGVAVLVVEQYAQEVLAVADAAALLVHGRIRMNGTPDDVEHHLARAYLGTLGDPPTARPTPRTTSAAQDTQDTAPENTAQSPHRTPPEHSRPVPPPSHRTADAAHEDPTRRVRPGRPARTGSAIIAVLGLALLVFCAAAFRRGHGLQTQLDQAALALLGLGLAVTGAAAWAGAFLIRPTLPRQERRTHDRNPNQGRSQGGGPDTPT